MTNKLDTTAKMLQYFEDNWMDLYTDHYPHQKVSALLKEYKNIDEKLLKLSDKLNNILEIDYIKEKNSKYLIKREKEYFDLNMDVVNDYFKLLQSLHKKSNYLLDVIDQMTESHPNLNLFISETRNCLNKEKSYFKEIGKHINFLNLTKKQ